MTWEDTGNELLSLYHVESFCRCVNPKQFQILRSPGAAGVPTAALELPSCNPICSAPGWRAAPARTRPEPGSDARENKHFRSKSRSKITAVGGLFSLLDDRKFSLSTFSKQKETNKQKAIYCFKLNN